ncbi:MAG: NDP-sugar synthase [Elusimicrobiota bacterium]|jgi:mannose-1-phosphate guanylyltransferase/phosphomannomutase|nr:NDP-sugar synthase [Elusimicrobiota bacterium]
MKAFILAAGIGTRLKPLTNTIPKPMATILGKPVLHHIVNFLRHSGFKTAMINLHYRSEVITNYFKSNPTELELLFSFEKKLLGTAGAIKKNAGFFEKTFVVISGDALVDIDLKKALAFHKEKKGIATIILKVPDFKLEYGVAITNNNGEIESFMEKPLCSNVFNDKVNTGIYIFEPQIFDFIPENKFFDFSKDLFPTLMRKKVKVFGFETKDYWKDIGDLSGYKNGNFDAIDGKIKLYYYGHLIKKSYTHICRPSHIHKSVKLYAPYFIGKNVVINENSVIKPYSVISDDTKIGVGVHIEKTVILNSVKISSGVKLTNSLVGNCTQIPSGMTLFNSVIMQSGK